MSLPAGAIAVVLPNWIGDGVMVTPALQALRDAASTRRPDRGFRSRERLRPAGRIAGFGRVA